MAIWDPKVLTATLHGYNNWYNSHYQAAAPLEDLLIFEKRLLRRELRSERSVGRADAQVLFGLGKKQRVLTVD